MATRKRKIRKKRGSRTCGGGSHKKSRNAGSRGGRGMGGTHKGKWTWIIKHDPDHFGRRGFLPPAAVREEVATVNIGEIDSTLESLLQTGVAEKKGKAVRVDVTKMGAKKVLGRGKVTRPMEVKAFQFSGGAIEKIEKAGGKAIVLGAGSGDAEETSE
jgi:large subunit ribosomal protein L15